LDVEPEAFLADLDAFEQWMRIHDGVPLVLRAQNAPRKAAPT